MMGGPRELPSRNRKQEKAGRLARHKTASLRIFYILTNSAGILKVAINETTVARWSRSKHLTGMEKNGRRYSGLRLRQRL